MSAPNVALPFRQALLTSAEITGLVASYKNSKAIFTRRPVPIDVPYPMIIINPDASLTDEDGINDYRPKITRDVIVYGQNDTPEKYRAVEDIAYLIRKMFHGNRDSLVVPLWHVVDIRTTGPIPAPTDDDKTIARVVPVTVRLAQQI